ncbi:c-type cytochrome [Sulfurimonas sp.]|uniref:c-type cytochrome n=1 Tax=Sulfurimonas sp. TaxID=2022749 RepID=UPI00286DADC0|nr:c-type cytochrome [Sulfurimonas sp.]
MKILISAVLALFLVGCSSDTKQQTKEIKQEVVAKAEATKEVVAEKVEEAKEAVSTQMDGAALYQVCAGCHGTDASKAALGKSQIIKGWDAKKIAGALHGYKAGTYGGAMKSVMAGQVSKLSDEDIKILSEHISKL